MLENLCLCGPCLVPCSSIYIRQLPLSDNCLMAHSFVRVWKSCLGNYPEASSRIYPKGAESAPVGLLDTVLWILYHYLGQVSKGWDEWDRVPLGGKLVRLWGPKESQAQGKVQDLCMVQMHHSAIFTGLLQTPTFGRTDTCPTHTTGAIPLSEVLVWFHVSVDCSCE